MAMEKEKRRKYKPSELHFAFNTETEVNIIFVNEVFQLCLYYRWEERGNFFYLGKKGAY